MKTDDFDAKSRSMRTTLKLSQDQAAAVTTAFTALGGALTQTGTQAGASAQGIDRATTSLKNVKKASDDVSGGLGSVAGGIKSLTTSLGGLALAAVSFQALSAGVGSLLASATASQSLTAAFTAIAGSAQEGQKQLDFVRVTADKLGFSFTTLAGSYKGLSAASRGTILEGQATRDLFTAVATASRVLQLSTQDTSGILNALQQIMSKGTVQAEELRGQIGERLPGAFSLTARAIGVTEKELTKLLETGNLGANVFIPKFASQLIKEYGGSAEAASKTFAAASERLSNAFARVGEAVAQSGILDHLGKILDKLAGIIASGPNAADALRKVTQAATAPARAALAPFGAVGAEDQATFDALAARITHFKDGIERQKTAKFDQAIATIFPFLQRTALATLQQNLAEAEAAYATFFAKLAVKQQATFGAQEEGLGSIPTSRYVRGQDLTKALQTQADELSKALAMLDVQAALVPGRAVEIVEEKVKLLDKAIKALQETLARNQDLLPLLQGKGGLNTSALTGANPAGLAATLPVIQRLAPQFGVDPALAAAIAFQESAFNPRAKGPTDDFGIFQLTPPIIKAFGVTDPFDIEQNVTAGLKLIRELMQRFPGDIAKQIAAFQAGPNAVDLRGALAASSVSARYVPAIQARLAALKGGGAPGDAVAPQQLTDLIAQRDRFQAERDRFQAQIDATKDFQADLIAQRRERLQDLDIFGLTLAPEQEAALKEAAKAQHARIKAFAEELDIFGLEISPEQERQTKLIQKATDALRAYQEQLELSGGALDAFGRATRITPEARAVTIAQERLAPLQGGPLAAQAQQVIDRAHRAALEATPAFQRLRTTVDGIAGGIVDLVESAASGELFRGLGPPPGAALDRARLRDIGAELAERRAGLAGTTDGNDRRRELEDIRRLQSAHTELTETIRQGAREQETLFGRISAAFSALVTRAILDSTQLREALGTVLLRVVQAGIGLVGGTGGGSPSALQGPTSSGATLDVAPNGGLAAGGHALAGQSYIVGERGRELFVPDQNGQVMPGRFYEVSGQGGGTQGRTGPESQGGGSGGQQGQRPVVINMTVIANEPSAFLQPQGKIQRAIAQGVQQASRNL